MLWLVGQGLERNEIGRYKTDKSGEKTCAGPVGMRKKQADLCVSH